MSNHDGRQAGLLQWIQTCFEPALQPMHSQHPQDHATLVEETIARISSWKVRVQSSPYEGVGVFALKDIQKEEVCFSYWGDNSIEISKEQLASAGLSVLQRKALEDLYYSTEKMQRVPIYPPEELLYASSINHSRSSANVMYRYPSYFAIKDIREGEELLIDYRMLPESFATSHEEVSSKYGTPDEYFSDMQR